MNSSVSVNNWYFFYDSRGIDEKDIKEISLKLDSLGYKYYQPTGLGAGPGLEQIVLWLNNNQFLSGVSIGILTNYFYDVLKFLYSWFKTHKTKNKTIPVVEIFLRFKDVESNRISAKLKFRIDQKLSKEDLIKSIRSQVKFLNASSNEDTVCAYCTKTIFKHTGFYLKRNDINKHICHICKNGKLLKNLAENAEK